MSLIPEKWFQKGDYYYFVSDEDLLAIESRMILFCLLLSKHVTNSGQLVSKR